MLILTFHGFVNNDNNQLAFFSKMAELERGPIVVAPAGTKSYGLPRGWGTRSSTKGFGPDGPTCSEDCGSFGCNCEFCDSQLRAKVCHNCAQWSRCLPKCVWAAPCLDDFKLMEALLDHFESEYRVDKQRIFLSGFSMGGILTWDAANHPRLYNRFTAIATVAGAPQAGFAQQAIPDGPWALGLWGAHNEHRFDLLMPAYSNFPGRPDKAQSTSSGVFLAFGPGRYYYNTALNATTTYAKTINCPGPGEELNVEDELMPSVADVADDIRPKCSTDGCGGTVIRCTWGTTIHTVPTFAWQLHWKYFNLVAEKRQAIRKRRKAAAETPAPVPEAKVEPPTAKRAPPPTTTTTSYPIPAA